MKPYTIDEVLALARRTGIITINPLKYRKCPLKNACFAAAKIGLLRKVRENCGRYNFYPIKED